MIKLRTISFFNRVPRMKILGIFFILFTIPSFNLLAQDKTALSEVLQSSKIETLANSRAWLKLLHIERNWLGIKKSQVTDQSFFFSKNKADAHAELIETLSSFTLPASQFAKEIKNLKNENVIDHSEHSICKYPARLYYLKKELPEYNDYWSNLISPTTLNIRITSPSPNTIRTGFLL